LMGDAAYDVAAIDARAMGLALSLDATGQQSRAAAVGRDVKAMRAELTRLQRALDRSKASQASQAKLAAGQLAARQEDVKALKGEIADLQKTLDETRTASAEKLDALASRLDQPKPETDGRLAEIAERLERIEKAPPQTVAAAMPAAATAPAAAPAPTPLPVATVSPPADEPLSTGSVRRDAPPARIVRNWSLREVYDGVALLEGRGGLVEVTKGVTLPGVGRVSSIERRNRQWVVVTDAGVIIGQP
jgi:hypothetical protein